MSVDPKWDPTGVSQSYPTRYRPVPRRGRVPRWVWLGVPIAAVVVVAIGVAAAWSQGYLGGSVRVTAVGVTYSGELLNGTAVTQTFATTTGATFIDNVTAVNSAPAPHTTIDYPEVCILGASIVPASFGVVGMTPHNICISGQNATFLYVTLAAPSRPYSGSITVTFVTDEQNAQN